MNGLFITMRKELRSIFRDRKTLVTLLIFPLFIPFMIFLYSFIYEEQMDGENYFIGVNYELNSTELSLMSEVNLEAYEYNSVKEMEQAYNRGEIFGYIDYDRKEKKYLIYTNEDSEDGMYVSNYVVTYLESYNDYLAKLELIGEDIDVDAVYDNLSYEIVNLEGENWLLNLMFSMSFTYIVMAIVVATTNMATSATAVEKENGTLETLLTFPVKSSDLVLGKYSATVVMGVISGIIGLILTIVSLFIATNNFSVFQDIDFYLSASSVMLSILIVILASFFIAGLSICLTSFAKSYKEAQSMSSVLNILTVIPMMISLIGISINWVYYLIPIFNYTQILIDIFSGNFDMLSILLVVISSVIFVIVVIWSILKRYRTEKVLFGDV